MLTEVNLETMLQPPAFPDRDEVYRLCLEEFCNELVTWNVNNDGKVVVIGQFDIKRFIKHGKLIVPFHYINTSLKLNAVRSLEGFPRVCTCSVDIRSSMLTSLKGCPYDVIGLNIEAPISSLQDGPGHASYYIITSDELTSLAGLSKTGINSFRVKCKNVKTTDGLDGVNLNSLTFEHAVEITEYPNSCSTVRLVDVISGYPRLFLSGGLSEVSFMPMRDSAKRNVAIHEFATLMEINKMVFAIEGPRKRFLEAQRQLIDADLERLL